MKIHTYEQRSPEWHEDRIGIPTASAFGKIVSASGKILTGATPRSYMLSLLGERLTRTPTIIRESAAMLRGRELEEFARRYYEESTGSTVKQVGFITDDLCRWGCSPDGIIDNCVGLEIKCPMLPAFLDYAGSREIPDDYYVQIQASMWITGFKFWHFLVYTDVRGMKPIRAFLEPDAKMMAAFDAALPSFCDQLDDMEACLRREGFGVPADTPVDLSALEEDVPDMDGIEPFEN
jgi:predicted phage-related endonuclease